MRPDLDLFEMIVFNNPFLNCKNTISERGSSIMLETMKYVRKPFYIDAVQVSAINIADVARWADGEVRSDGDGTQYVKVRVHRPLNDRQTRAYVGDWVLYAGTGFKVYTPKAFANSFEQASVETTMQDTTPPVVETELVAVVEKPVVKKAAKVKAPVPGPPVAVAEAI